MLTKVKNRSVLLPQLYDTIIEVYEIKLKDRSKQTLYI